MVPALVLAVAYLVVSPSSADLAAQTFRSDLFSAHGFLLWNNAWYSGHYVPSYSLVFPPLAALTDPRVVGAIAAVAAAALFGAIARRRFGDGARIGTLWFGVATATMLLSGRLTFALGLAIGLGALVALQRGAVPLAVVLAAVTALASPVAGLFLALAGAAVFLAGGRAGGAVAAAALLAIALLGAAFPTGGEEPFVFSAFFPIPLFGAFALWLLPREERALRIGVALYVALAVALYLVPTPIGGNVTRLGQLAAGPVLAVALSGSRARVLAVAAIALLYWQWSPSVRDVAAAEGDPSVESAYYEPLLAELDQRVHGPARIEIPPTQNRWEATYVAPQYPLARGWMRQLESDDFDTFDDGGLDAEGYRSWLTEKGVSWVAVPGADLDYLAEDEAALIAGGLPYLHAVWEDDDWTLYRVRGAGGLLARPGDPPSGPGAGNRVSELDPEGFTLRLRTAGPYLVRVNHSRYWRVTEGAACVTRDGDLTAVEARTPGEVRVEARFDLDGLLGRERDCSG